RRFGAQGDRIWRLAHGQDERRVSPDAPMKSVSAETTFATDIADPEALRDQLWHLCEKVSARMKAKGLAGRVVTLKLRRKDFSALTRQRALTEPAQLADTLFTTGSALLAALDPGPCRLIGIGYS